ncbi:MAG: alpha/beta fold hydrolase [Chloroflexota bacterium]
MQFKKLTIHNEAGQKLGARLDLPVDGQPAAFAVFAHCFTCGKNLRAINHISRALTASGLAVLRFDFTGLGESEGDFADTNFSSNVADLVAAANYLAREFEAPQLLVGHSLGGAAVLMAAQHLPSVTAVVTIGAPCNPDHVTHLVESSRAEIEVTGQAEVLLAGRKFTIKKQFLDDLAQQKMTAVIANLRRALLVCHAPLDSTVGVDNAAHIFLSAKHPKSFVSLDDADHLLTKRDAAAYVGSMIATWASKYITAKPPQPAATAAENNWVAVRTGSTFRTEIRSRSGHTVIADEPIQLGGTNLGPNPYDYLLAALGSCTSITLRMYADRKKWPLTSVTVRLTHDKIHAADCAACESGKGRIDYIVRELELEGPLDDKQRQRLVEIADKCPVHRTLHNEIVVNTVVK